MARKRVLIVGGVAGGAGTAARLRRLDEDAEIVVFERGPHVSYANCGLPYYAGGAIRERDALFLMDAARFKAALDVDVLTRREALSIDRAAKKLRVKDLDSGAETEEPYDVLVLAPGASPLRPPIPGIDDPAVLSLRSVEDADAVKARIDAGAGGTVAVVGGGFIGLEMAENLRERGWTVVVIEALDQVLAPLDYEMAVIVQAKLRDKGVKLVLKDPIAAFERDGAALAARLASGAVVRADFALLSIGVRPESALAREAGLDIAPNGAIRVDEFLRTSDPSIYAVGAAIEFKPPILGVPVSTALAGPANKQARICAENIALGNVRAWKGAFGTAAAKVFDLTVAATGLPCKALAKAGIAHASVIVHAGEHAGYYPGSKDLVLKVAYDPGTGRVLGAQCVGGVGAVKRIDVISAIMGLGGTVSDLASFEQAYAPPYSSARDPVNVAGFVAENAMAGLGNPVPWTEVESWRARGAFFLDVRTGVEFAGGAIPGSANIPHTELRARLGEIPKGAPVLVNCAGGLRAYLAERILRQRGWTDVGNLSGGYKTWKRATDAALDLRA